jgi:serine/threonine protein phosphatase PrpC
MSNLEELTRQGFCQPQIMGSSLGNMAFAECQGRREKMEDVAYTDELEYADKIVRIAGLFDGHNGQKGAMCASSYAVDFFEDHALELIDELQETARPLPFMTKLQERIAQRCLSGTTALMAVVYEDKTADIVNIGDSRCLAFGKDGSIRQITVDHSAKNPDEVALVVANGGFVVNNRVDAISMVTRALGDAHLHVLHTPDVFRVNLADVAWLIMACDGVFDVLSNEMVHALCAQEKVTPREAALKIINAAYNFKAHDNLSVVCIKFD